MKKGGSIKKLAPGGLAGPPRSIGTPTSGGGQEGSRSRTAPMAGPPQTGSLALYHPMGMAKGGSVNGVAKKGKTSTKMVKMAKGGSFRSSANGIASRGKTKGRMC